METTEIVVPRNGTAKLNSKIKSKNENITFQYKDKNGTAKLGAFSLPFLPYCAEKSKSGRSHYFLISLSCFSSFQNRESCSLFSLSLFSLSLFLISLQPNRL
jgi:hypothetical protein